GPGPAVAGIPPSAMAPPGARPGPPPGPPMGGPVAPPPPQARAYRPPSPTVAPPRGSAAVVVDGTNRRFDLTVGRNLIGRGTDADLQLLDQGVSRRHAEVQWDGSFATVYDLGSTNGTSVNGHEVASHVLRHGDVIRLGHTRLVFQ